MSKWSSFSNYMGSVQNSLEHEGASTREAMNWAHVNSAYVQTSFRRGLKPSSVARTIFHEMQDARFSKHRHKAKRGRRGNVRRRGMHRVTFWAKPRKRKGKKAKRRGRRGRR